MVTAIMVLEHGLTPIKQHTLVNGKMAPKKEKELKPGLTVMFMKVNSMTVNGTEKGHLNFQMGHLIQVNGKTIRCMEKELLSGQMEK